MALWDVLSPVRRDLYRPIAMALVYAYDLYVHCSVVSLTCLGHVATKISAGCSFWLDSMLAWQTVAVGMLNEKVVGVVHVERNEGRIPSHNPGQFADNHRDDSGCLLEPAF